jgi:hypothetical protein
MPDNRLRLIKNDKRRPCKRCDGEHEYVTRLSDDADCSTPVAFTLEKAQKTARLLARGEESIVLVPPALSTLVVLDDEARRLPKNEPTVLAQYVNVIQSA